VTIAEGLFYGKNTPSAITTNESESDYTFDINMK